jgi:hypothetical protein
MNKKLLMIRATGETMQKIRDNNVEIVLQQNAKLIEECNLLRNECEYYSSQARKRLNIFALNDFIRLKTMKKS